MVVVVQVPSGTTSRVTIVPARLSYIADIANVPACGRTVYTRNEFEWAVTRFGR